MRKWQCRQDKQTYHSFVILIIRSPWVFGTWLVRSLIRIAFDWNDNAEWKRLFFVYQIRFEILTRCRIKYFALRNGTDIFVILGKGYAPPIVFSFSARKSITILHLLLLCESGFLETTHIGELYGEFEGLITSLIINSFTCLLISSLWKRGNLY